MIRSVLAVLAGIVTLTVVSFGIEALATPLLGHGVAARVVMYGYGTLSVAAGGYVTAWLAARAPLRHAIIMGLVQVALTVLAMAAMWNHAPAVSWIVTLVMTLPAAVLGGWLRTALFRTRLQTSVRGAPGNSPSGQ